jgi:ubiquinone/menaquinone biosynthesis C-methylase UbiE
MSGSSKQAEKEYLARTGSSAWERAKPFSHAGADTLTESALLLHDFAVAMLTLEPAPGDLILDLGAGACWCSDLLGRLNRKSIAVDISLDMLRAGRARPSGDSIRAVAGDLELLPFRTATFRKAVCLNAIHHVPDIPKAIREVARVLTEDGVALFSEPGLGHAQAAVATAAVSDFGVLEQEVLIAEFTRACRNAGFVDVRIKMLSHAVPRVDLGLEEWESWCRLASSRRPIRALRKIVRGVAEMLGLGKRGPLFEEAFGMTLVRTLRHTVEHHPIIVASKAPLRQRSTVPAWSAAMNVVLPNHVRAGNVIPVRARVTNTGPTTWLSASPGGPGQVSFGVQLLDSAGRLMVRDHHRVPLPHDVAPGGSVTLDFSCPVPKNSGAYVFKFDMVAEGVTWFEPVGSAIVTRSVTVESGV